MPPLTDQLYPFLTILAGIENSINLTSVDPPMRYLLDHNDKIAISNGKIFYLDPFELRTFDDAYSHCQDRNHATVCMQSNYDCSRFNEIDPDVESKYDHGITDFEIAE